MLRRSIVIGCLWLCALIPCHARADSRIIVHDFYGPGAARLRSDVVNILEQKPSVTIVSQGQVESVAKKLGVDPFSPEGRRMLSKELQLSAWLTGVVKQKAGRLTLTLLVFDGAEHARIGRAELSAHGARQLSAKVKGQLWDKAQDAILGAAPPAAAEANAKVLDEEPRAARGPADMVMSVDETERTAQERRPGEALQVFLGVGSPYRSLAYNDAVSQNLGDYQLSGAPLADLQLELFPARFAGDGFLSWLGIDARTQLALAAPTRDRDGNAFKSHFNALHAGVRVRVPLGLHSVSAFTGFAMRNFTISQEGQVAAPAPNVEYKSIRSGIGGQLAVSDTLALGLDAAYLNMLSVGQIGQWFPRATAAAVELAGFATYGITRAVHARLSASYQRTFFDFHAQPGDKHIAGGAIDQYLALTLGAGVEL